MFSDIGNKLKSLIIAVFVMFTIIVLGADIYVCLTWRILWIHVVSTISSFLLIFFFWLRTWLIFGYGEIIESNMDLARDVAEMREDLQSIRKAANWVARNTPGLPRE